MPLVIGALKHPDVETRECAAATIGNLAAGNASIMDSEGAIVPLVKLLEAAVPSLIHIIQKAKSGSWEDCAGGTSPHASTGLKKSATVSYTPIFLQEMHDKGCASANNVDFWFPRKVGHGKDH